METGKVEETLNKIQERDVQMDESKNVCPLARKGLIFP